MSDTIDLDRLRRQVMSTQEAERAAAEIASLREQLENEKAWHDLSKDKVISESHAAIQAESRATAAERALAEIISAHDEWAAGMEGLEFDDPLSDAVEAARRIVPSTALTAGAVLEALGKQAGLPSWTGDKTTVVLHFKDETAAEAFSAAVSAHIAAREGGGG